jgi:hypothetical protein
MKPVSFSLTALALMILLTGCAGTSKSSDPSKKSPTSRPVASTAAEEVELRYSKARPEIQEYVLWTAKSFGPNGLWLPENAFANLPPEQRENRIVYLAALFNDAEYGRHLCAALAEAGALKDPRLVPGLMRVAGYQVEGRDYDCRPKWMAVAALARQESPDAVPLLISLVDCGNQNTRNWAQAALTRLTGQDFKQDKQAWADWWQAKGHPAVDPKFLKPWVPPAKDKQ